MTTSHTSEVVVPAPPEEMVVMGNPPAPEELTYEFFVNNAVEDSMSAFNLCHQADGVYDPEALKVHITGIFRNAAQRIYADGKDDGVKLERYRAKDE